MKNEVLVADTKKIINTPKVNITKGTVGGLSIEVNVQEPVYEDIGSYIYKNEVDRDADFDKITKLKEANV